MANIDNDAMLQLVKDAQQGDEHALNDLVERNTGLVWSVVKRYMGKGTEPEDLYQLGSIGLTKSLFPLCLVLWLRSGISFDDQ